ncbi:MAG: hypothetical protein J5806_13885 [Lentisphaeria bacterium]|nr:hypothetical protein [Lentisphaeria bacterium]
MNKISPALLLMLTFCFMLPLSAEDQVLDSKTMTPEQFLSRVRNPPGRDSWALMKGSAQHRRDNARPVKAELEMGIFFTPVRTLAQIRFNGTEIYTIGQSYGKDGSTHVEKRIPSGVQPQIEIYGITPEDLAMSFLYWDFRQEHPQESIRGQDCRVFTLVSKNGAESVKVAISCEYFFPLRAEWFRNQEKEPVRKLEAAAFKKNNDYWFVSKLILSGKNWATTIRFPEADAGPFKDKLPSGLFVE